MRHADGSEGHLFLAAAFAASATAVLKERRPPVRLTLTWDQGSEMPGTILLGRNITDGIYFAPPGPWLHGPDENTVGLVVARLAGPAS